MQADPELLGQISYDYDEFCQDTVPPRVACSPSN